MHSRFVNDGKALLKLNALQQKTKQQVIENLSNSHYPLEQIPCPICNGNKFEPLAEKDRYGIPTAVVVCKTCGLVLTNPRMTQESYNAFYAHQYRNLYVGTESPTETFFNKQYNQGRKVFRYLSNRNNFKPQGKLVLEVGCGAGGILKYFKDQGCEVIGLDLGETYLNYGKHTHGLDLRVGALSSAKLERKPDLIIYSHVFEHILNPNQELKDIDLTLADAGICYIEVPGVKYLSASYNRDLLRYLQNAHVFHYTLTTLKNLLHNNGFEVLHGNEFIRLTFKKQHEQTVTSEISIENDYTHVISFLKRLHRYRYLLRLFPYNWQRSLLKSRSF